jgi:hypothetical protein
VNDFGDVLRDMAGEGPSDDGLLGAVHAASARAAVRRRAVLASAAALTVLLGGIGVIAAKGSDDPGVRDQVFGASDGPPAQRPGTPSTVPSAEPPAGGTGASARPTGTYRGRAVSSAGKPVAGLYVYVLPHGFHEVEAFHRWLAANRPFTLTRSDGTFSIPCPSGPVLLTSWPFQLAQSTSTPSWAAVFVGGASAPSESTIPRCRRAVQTTQVFEGAVIQGSASGPGLLCPSTYSVVGVFGTGQDSIFSWKLSTAWTHEGQDGAFRIAGLPVGTYWVGAYNAADPQEDEHTGYARAQVKVTGPGLYEVELSPTWDGQDSSCPGPTPGSTQSPDAIFGGEPSATPAPSPSA